MKTAWKRITLGDVCGITSKLVDPRLPDFQDLLHVGAGNMETGNGELKALLTAREEGLISGKFLFDEKVVLYSKIRPYLMKVARPDFEGLCSADVYPLEPSLDQINRDFLYHLMLSPGFTDYAVKGSARAGMPKVNRDHVFAFEFVLPPLQEQQRIVTILDEALDGINTAKANAEKNLQNAREVFESHLQSALTLKKEGWTEKLLGELASFSSGGTPSKQKASYWEGSIPWVSGRDMKTDRIGDAALHISKAALDASATRIAPIGSLLILVRGMGLANGVAIAELVAPCAFNQDIKAIRAIPGVDPRFLLFSLRTKLAQSDQILSSAAHGTLKIDTEVLQSITLSIPSLEFQQKTVKQIDELQEETKHLEINYQQKIAALDELKQSLLHRAFSGDL